ncbi:non-ribosomal peptide synthetase [Dactylosporangium sp. CA-233914]|uniref:non-ribosomal peptide synthetase n=1 Tax=Dactylosporangium sp. CA-233914 TaxID=3239934 RepID=UPI003D90FF70
MTPNRPLSPAQHGIWFNELTQPVGTVYHLALRVTFTGPLDTARLAAACDAVVARHPVLATAVRLIDGEPALVPVPAPTLRRVTGAAALAEELTRPFALDTGPLCRFTLDNTDPGRQVLLVVAHHLVFDGTSKDLLLADLAAAYQGEELPPLPGQGPDPFGPELEPARAYWRTAWQEPAEVLLPGAVTVAEPAAPAEVVEVPIDARLGAALSAVADTLGATRFEVLLTALRAVLLRYGNDPATVAVDLDIRTEATRGHIGMYVNQLPVTAALDPRGSFRAAVAATRENLRALYRLRQVPLSRAVSAVPAGLALAPMSVSYRRQHRTPCWPGSTTVDVDWAVFNQAGRRTLHLQAVDGPDRLRVGLHFRPAGLARGTAVRVAGHLRELLAAATAEPDRSLAELPVLTAQERDELRAWNHTTTAYPDTSTIDELITARLRDNPGAVAVESDGPDRVRLTRGELNALANRFAHELRAYGAGPGRPVGVLARRGADLIVGVLAVLKAGAVYLPLDPDQPDPRLYQILADSGAELVLCASQLAPRLAGAPVQARALLLEQPPAGQPDTDPPPQAVAADPAYLIYTSGSTGAPKGVLNSHRGICNRLDWMQRAFPIDATDAVLHKTPIGFDVSVWELLWPLLAGARLVPATPGGHRDPGYLHDVINRHRVTTVHFVPSMLAAFLEEPGVEDCTSLKRTICSGEELTPALASVFLARMPGELYNLYGPTEAAIDVTAWHCTPSAVQAAARLPIGHPIQNMRLAIVDAWDNDVPVEVAGELLLAGPGVALGYHNLPALTARRFVTDPGGPPGSRRYRTGDLCRWRADGTVEYLGRIDRQLKLRGTRIEPVEIEAAFNAHPAVAQAAVTVTGTGDERRLVAAVTPVAGTDTTGLPADLRAHLAARLPEAMVPTHIAVFDTMPLTANGKLDHTAIAAASTTRPAAAPPARMSRPVGGTPDEAMTEQIRAIWAEVLGVPDVGPDDDLFDLGGHSLTVTQIAARMRRRLGIDLPLHAFYDASTISGLLAVVGRRSA